VLLTNRFREEESILTPELRPGHGPLVHGELMAAQGEVFEGELAMAAA
jgi:hypothetical protein